MASKKIATSVCGNLRATVLSGLVTFYPKYPLEARRVSARLSSSLASAVQATLSTTPESELDPVVKEITYCRTSFEYHALIDRCLWQSGPGWRAIGRSHLVRDIYEDMLMDGVKPTRETYWRCISGMTRNERQQDAFFFFNEMQKHGFPPNIRVYNTLIHACGRVFDLDMAFRLSREMEVRGMEPDFMTLLSLLNAAGNAGHVREALGIVDRMRAQEFFLPSSVYVALIHAYKNARFRGYFAIMPKVLQIVHEWRKSEGLITELEPAEGGKQGLGGSSALSRTLQACSPDIQEDRLHEEADQYQQLDKREQKGAINVSGDLPQADLLQDAAREGYPGEQETMPHQQVENDMSASGYQTQGGLEPPSSGSPPDGHPQRGTTATNGLLDYKQQISMRAVYHAAMDVCVELNDVATLQDILDLMEKDQRPPNTSTYLILIRWYIRRGHFVPAREMWEKAQKCRWPPSYMEHLDVMDRSLLRNREDGIKFAVELVDQFEAKGLHMNPINGSKILLHASNPRARSFIAADRIADHLLWFEVVPHMDAALAYLRCLKVRELPDTDLRVMAMTKILDGPRVGNKGYVHAMQRDAAKTEETQKS